uniref:Ig-like domain-containing protein n=1 Tax=Anopheles funestus TaxID=62324 RepID=A0A182R938_ANOFN
MMYQCCLIVLMIAHCVSSTGQPKQEYQLTHPSNTDDIQNTSQIASHTSSTGRIESNFAVGDSGIGPLNEQDVYDENDTSENDESDTDNDRPVTVEENRYDADDNSNGIIHDSPVRIMSPLNGGMLASTSVHVSVQTELNDLEAVEDTLESDGSKRFLQHHYQNPREPRKQLQQTEGTVVQLPSSLLGLTTNVDSSSSFSTTDLSGLTVSATVEDVSQEQHITNLSLSTQRTIRRPSSGVQLAMMVHNAEDGSKPMRMEAATHSHNDPPKSIQKHSPAQQSISDASRRNNPISISNFHSITSNDTLTTATASSLQRHRTINSMNLNPTTPAMVVKPVGEHRKLLKSTGPILNYVFDHHPPYYKSTYYNTRYGPHFETDNVTNITVQNGDTLFLSCRISLLQDKTVSWVRRKSGDTALQLLTVGKQTYSGDSRYQIEFQYPNNWRLKISRANKNDEGVYECQISTHPPKVIIYYLYVNAPEVAIVDEEGAPLYDKYYEVGSTIKLMCKIRHISMLRSVVYWIHNENILNHDTTRGGISVKTNLTSIGANSTLFVAKVNRQDSGSYTCSIGPNQHYSISVHVLNGTANPFGIYQRSCAFPIILQAVDLWLVIRSLFFLLLKLSVGR